MKDTYMNVHLKIDRKIIEIKKELQWIKEEKYFI